MHHIDFGKIVSRSYELVRKNLFLWGLGILVAGSSFPLLNNFGNTPTTASAPTRFDQKISDYALNHASLVIFLIICVAALVIGLIYISFTCYAGLVLATDKLESNHKLGFAKSYRMGREFAWRLIGLHLLMLLFIFLALVVVFIPIGILVANFHVAGLSALAVVMLIILIPALVVGLLYASVLLPFAARSIVLRNSNVGNGIRYAQKLIHEHLGDSAITWAIGIAIQFVSVFLLLALLFILVFFILVISLLAHAAAGGPVGLAVGITLGSIAAIAIVLPVGGAIKAFYSVFWTLSYRALEYLDSKKN